MANTAELLKEIQDGMDDYRKAYDDSIETIKTLSLNPANLREDSHLCSRCDGTDKLGEICQWSWRELIREFGSDEQKAEVFCNYCTDEVENVG